MSTPTTGLTIVFPCAPDLRLSGNRRQNSHWRNRWRAVNDLFEGYGSLVKSAAPPEPLTGPLRYDAVIGWPKGQRFLDFDGAIAVLKSHIDLLATHGWMENDRQITGADVTQVRDATQPGGFVRITLRSIA